MSFWMNHWLRDLPSTNYRIAASVWLSAGTAIVYWYCLIAGMDIPEGPFALWLTFLAAMQGITYLQFKNKRETEHVQHTTEQPVVRRPVEPQPQEERIDDPGASVVVHAFRDGEDEAEARADYAEDVVRRSHGWQPRKLSTSIRVSTHFRLAEFQVSGGFPALVKPVPASLIPNVKRLAVTCLEPIRIHVGQAVTVLSGYRPPQLNTRVGGSPTSQHLKAAAADITMAKDVRLLFEWILANPDEINAGQVIFYPSRDFIHVALPTVKHPTTTCYVHAPEKQITYTKVGTVLDLKRLLKEELPPCS